MDERQPYYSGNYEALPAEVVTVDQVIAWNMRRWRTARHMTQEELGEMIGWSAANVSAAERSVDGDRDRRRFDAQTIADVATALGLPVVALFLPPEDDGQGKQYAWRYGKETRGMVDLMLLAMHRSDEPDDDVTDAYRDRFRAAVTYYIDEDWGAEVGRWFAPMDDRSTRLEAAGRFRDRQQRLLAMAADDGAVADWLEQPAEEEASP